MQASYQSLYISSAADCPLKDLLHASQLIEVGLGSNQLGLKLLVAFERFLQLWRESLIGLGSFLHDLFQECMISIA